MILVIDNYDSFTYNLVALVEQLGYPTKVSYSDKLSINDIRQLNPDKIIISPGPGTPEDTGISREAIKEFHSSTPILGVCLGHQCIGVNFGAELVHAKKIMHGKTSEVRHTGKSIFKGIELPFIAARYHSLALEGLKSPLKITAWSEDDTIMALEHESYPLYGVQFHPESFMTTEGLKIMRNFLR